MVRFIRELWTLGEPEYRARHLFTAKFRMALFLGFWFAYVLLLKNELDKVTHVTITISVAFVFTIIAYYLIIVRSKVGIAILVEILADVISLSAILYLTGGIYSDYFTIYIFYVLVAGAFYNYRLAVVTAIFSLAAYLAMGVAQINGWISLVPLHFMGWKHIHVEEVTEALWLNPVMLAVGLIISAYVTKISSHFSKRREMALEERNRELKALHNMSNTIRSSNPLDDVVDKVLKGIETGLDFTFCLLMLVDRDNNCLTCHPPKDHPVARRAEEVLGFPLSQLSLSLSDIDNTSIQSLRNKEITFNRDLSELMQGLTPAVEADQALMLQSALGVQVIVGMPLVVGDELVGACIGMSCAPYLEEQAIATMEAFANQAALSIQTAMMISELKRKNLELIEANRVKSEFLATMSHELRTPLTAIIGFSELLLEGVMGELSSEQRESLREVLNNGTSLLDLINNLLDLAKVESGKMGLHYQYFSLVDMVDRLRRNLSPLIQRKNQKWETEVAQELPPIHADEKRIQQVMLNLISNAIKFTPPNGRICVRLAHFTNRDHLSEALKAKVSARYFLVAVEDSGIGIAQENQEHIFEMFKQVDSSATRQYEGTGLGLALAKQLVELHGGVIWVESALERGSIFTCLIPSD